MGEFSDMSIDTSDVGDVGVFDLSETNEWSDFDSEDITDIPSDGDVAGDDLNDAIENISDNTEPEVIDVSEDMTEPEVTEGTDDLTKPEVESTEEADGINLSESETEESELSEAEKAADYARSYGFDKAADYIERHFDGEHFNPGDPIPIKTRNMGLDGMTAENGVPFERQRVELTDGLSVEGVFPEFDSLHHVELGQDANNMSLHEQFSACKEDFQEHLYDNHEIGERVTFGEMERMDESQGYTPEGYTWQHNPATGSFDLVSREDHAVGHTGGNALWGK